MFALYFLEVVDGIECNRLAMVGSLPDVLAEAKKRKGMWKLTVWEMPQ